MGEDIIVETLEPLVDKHGMTHVLAGLALMCFEKAEHLRVNWQDIPSAKTWERAGKRVEELAANPVIASLP